MIISKRFESRDKTVKNILILKVNNLSFKKKGTEIHFQIESKSKEIFTKSSQFSLNELKMNIDTSRSIDQLAGSVARATLRLRIEFWSNQWEGSKDRGTMEKMAISQTNGTGGE